MLALISLLAGMFVSFFGYRIRKLWGAICAFTCGYFGFLSILSAEVGPYHPIPYAAGLLGACICAVLSFLMKSLVHGLIVGGVVSAVIIVADSDIMVSTNARYILLVIVLCSCTLLSIKSKDVTAYLSTSMGGALIVVFGLDQYAGKGFTSTLFAHTTLAPLLGVDAAVPPTCAAPCYIICGVWLALSCMGAFAQFVLANDMLTVSAASHISGNAEPEASVDIDYTTFLESKKPSSDQSHKRALFNYLDKNGLPPLADELSKSLEPIFFELADRFGFQLCNMENQLEHMTFLLINLYSRNEDTFISDLHRKLFSNYRTWCRHLSVKPLIFPDEIATDQNLFTELALWLMIWGEAANLRHVPECLCYLFHNMRGELNGRSAPTQRREGMFLSHVVMPIFDVIRAEKGDIYTKKRNYDDFNEFFWSRDCLNSNYASRIYLHKTKEPQRSSKKSVASILKNGHKTYIERRSWLHPIRSFFRLLTFLMIAFHLLVCVAFLRHAKRSLTSYYSIKVLSSSVLSLSTLSLIKELVDIWACLGIIKHSLWRTLGFIFRLAVKSIFFLYLMLFYIWSYERAEDGFFNVYCWIAAAFVLPHAFTWLAQFFPSTSSIARLQSIPLWSSLMRIWWPDTRNYVGRNTSESQSHAIKYQAYWILLFAWKFYCSYLFQISPLIQPTLDLVEDNIDNESFPGMNTLLLILQWLPFVLVYIFDPVIWFALFQGLVGVIVGFSQKIGQIRDFAGLLENFDQLPQRFHRKLFGYDAELSDVSTHGFNSYQASDLSEQKESSSEIVNFHGIEWHHFGRIWNEIVKEMRQQDMVNNEELRLLSFRFIQEANNHSNFFLPLFLTAGVVDQMFEACNSFAARYNKSEDHTKFYVEKELATYMTNPLRREVVAELWSNIVYLLNALLGGRHEYAVSTIFRQIYGYVENGAVLDHINLQKLGTIKKPLLNLLRGLRIAQASYTTEKKKQKRSLLPEGRNDDSDNSDSLTTSIQQMGHAKLENAMRKVASIGTLKLLDKIAHQPRYRSFSVVTKERKFVSLPLHLIRDQLTALLTAIGRLMKDSSSSGAEVNIADVLKSLLVDEKGFMWNDAYTVEQVTSFFESPKCPCVCQSIRSILTVAQVDTQPQVASAKNRLLFFANSLFMNLPSVPSIQKMFSWSVLTPFYSEDIQYSLKDLNQETPDGLSTIVYLQTIYPIQWRNFLERVGAKDDSTILQDPRTSLAARNWATARGQTLGRTVDGMMRYHKALKLLAGLENPHASPEAIDKLANQKFQYVVSAQVYGRQLREGSAKARQIEALLRRYPQLRIAYIDSRKVQTGQDGKYTVETQYYSVLIKNSIASGENEIRECYRIRLPGNPILGEGKPENQNHAIIFTRGELLQAIDMNQDNTLEDALKMRNLLQEFSPKESYSNNAYPVENYDASPASKPPAIVGFRENIYTGSLSSVANYMAMQEGCFVTLGQRVLTDPLRMRLHYGHPDMFDKLFFLSRGGVSKASKGINLSEDIFAGFNTVLRGGTVSFKEYIQVGKGRDVGLQQLFKFEAKLSQGAAMQCLSRDVYRMCHSLDFFRLCSWFYGGIGFYITNSLTIAALFLFLYARVFLAACGLENPHNISGIETISYWFGQIGFLLTFPIYCSIGLDKGFRQATKEVAWMIVTGGPIFFMFHMGTKAHYFNLTLLSGGAIYRPTGRGFVTKHEDFGTLYRFHASSHFYKAMELMLLLLLYAVLKPTLSPYFLTTWAGWLIVIGWLCAPFWFNPMAFEWEKNLQDAGDFSMWMSREDNDPLRSWRAWWDEETKYLGGLDWSRKALLSLLATRHAIVGLAVLFFSKKSSVEIVVCLTIIIIIAGLIYLLQARINVKKQLLYRGFTALVIPLAITLLVVLLAMFSVDFATITSSFFTFVALFYMFATVNEMAIVLGNRSPVFVNICMFQDYFIASTLLFFLGVLSLLGFPNLIQTRLMFHNAFSRGVLIDRLLHGKNSDPSESITSTHPRPLHPSQQKSARESLNKKISSQLGDLSNTSSRSTSPTRSSSLLSEIDPGTGTGYGSMISVNKLTQRLSTHDRKGSFKDLRALQNRSNQPSSMEPSDDPTKSPDPRPIPKTIYPRDL